MIMLQLNLKLNKNITNACARVIGNQRLPIALAQVKTGNNSEDLLTEIRQIVSVLYWSKEIQIQIKV